MRRLAEWMQRLILNPPGIGIRILAALFLVGSVTGLRWFIDRGAHGFPLTFHIPVIAICAALFGWEVGCIAAVASAASVGLLLWQPSVDGEYLQIALILVALTLAGGSLILMAEMLRRMIFRLAAHDREVEILNRELRHRTKNAMQLLLAIIERSLRTDDPKEYLAPLPGRLKAWARALEQMRPGAEVSSSLNELCSSVLESFDRDRISLPSGDLRINASAASPLLLVIHELATNATKYGALSTPTGKVVINWTDSGEFVALQWQEMGGPPVNRPVRRGIGTALMVPRDGLQKLVWTFDESGVEALLHLAKP